MLIGVQIPAFDIPNVCYANSEETKTFYLSTSPNTHSDTQTQ